VKMKQAFKYNDKFYQSVNMRANLTAQLVFEALGGVIDFESVVDLGCGGGVWLEKSIVNGASRAVGIDLPSSIRMIRQNPLFTKYIEDKKINLIERDFVENSDSKLPFADIAICIEVAEHLPKQLSSKLVDRLCEASECVVFSAAQPGQGGTYHINEQPLSYWTNLFKRNGYVAIDLFRPELLQNHKVPRFYSLNLLLFLKQENEKYPICVANPQEIANHRILHVADLEKRTSIERIRYTIVNLLPVFLVTLISRRVKY
jgi:hypothetical protein